MRSGTRRGPADGAAGGVAAALLASAVAVLGPGASGLAAQEEGDRGRHEMARVVDAVERLDDLRSSLATAFAEGGAEADRETFRQVCRPVGETARRMAVENGWIVAQLSRRYRNPAHAPDAAAERVLQRMEDDGGLMAVWARETVEGAPGSRYYRRITVEPACLACHGAKERRPAFVKEGYPRDRAHGFEPGDLRGVYSVFVPDSAGGGDPAHGEGR